MAFARFARDSPSPPEIRLIDRPKVRSPRNSIDIRVYVKDPDRSVFDSLANRVNAIDPYGIFRYHITPCAIVNPWVSARDSKEHRSVLARSVLVWAYPQTSDQTE